MSTPAGIRAQVLRSSSGDAILLEVQADFVAALQRLLQEPLGAVLSGCGSPGSVPAHPLLNLAASAPMAFSASPVDWAAACLGEGSRARDDAEQIVQSPSESPEVGEAAPGSDVVLPCLRCLKEFGQRRLVTPAAACCYCNTVQLGSSPGSESDHTAACYCPSCGTEALIVASTGCCTSCGAQRMVTLKQVRDWPLCASCAAGHTLAAWRPRSSKMRQDCPCGECGKLQERCCEHCGCCDPCSLRRLGYPDILLEGCSLNLADHTSTGGSTSSASGPGGIDGPSGSTRHLVTNMLDVMEASAGKVMELVVPFQGRDPSGNDVTSETVLVTPEKLREVVLRALLGSTEVLTQSFPPKARRRTSSSNSAMSAAGTEKISGPQPCLSSQKTRDDELMLALTNREISAECPCGASEDGSDGGASFEMEHWVSDIS